jgi:MFS family permease
MLSLTYLALILFIFLIEFNRKKENKFDFLTLFHLFYLLWYPLPALVLDINQFNNSSEVLALKYDNRFYTSNIQTAVAIFLGYFCVIVGFYSNSAKQSAKNVIINKCSDKRVLFYSIILLLIASISMFVYSSGEGGLLLAISKAMLARVSQEANLASGNKFLFLSILAQYSFYASYLSGSFIFFKQIQTHRWFVYTVFLFSVIISILAAILAGGRQRVINYVLIFYLGYVLRTKKLSLSLLIPFLSFAIIFILYGKAFFFSLGALPDGFDAFVDAFVTSLQTKSSDNEFNFYSFITGFVYPVHSLDAAFNNEYDMRLFIDFILGFVDLIPKQLFGIESPKTIVDYNSYFIANNETSIPPGFLAFAIYSMSWTGLITFCFAFGWLGRYLQTILTRYLDTICWVPLFYATTVIFWTSFCGSGDPQFFIKGYFCYLTSSFFLLFIVHKTSLSQSDNHKQVGRKSRVY